MGKDQELLDAARCGNVAVVDKILAQRAKRSGPLASLRRGPGANIQDSSGYTPLHHAALNGHKEIVRLLLAADASPNTTDSSGAAPLHLAAWAGHADIVRALLAHTSPPVDVDLQTKDLSTALQCAARYGHASIVAQLLARGADPRLRNGADESALDLAAQYGRLDTVDMLVRTHPDLLEAYRPPASRGRLFQHTPLHRAAKNGHKSVVRVLLRGGMDVDARTSAGSALHGAALCGKARVVRELLSSGAHAHALDARGRTAMDLLAHFPPHATREVVQAFHDYNALNGYDSDPEVSAESDDLPPIPVSGAGAGGDIGSPYDNVLVRAVAVAVDDRRVSATSNLSIPMDPPTSSSPKPSAVKKSLLLVKQNNYVAKLASKCFGLIQKSNSASDVSTKSVFGSGNEFSKSKNKSNSTNTLRIGNSSFFKKHSGFDSPKDEIICKDDQSDTMSLDSRLTLNRVHKFNKSNKSFSGFVNTLPNISEKTEFQSDSSLSINNSLYSSNTSIEIACPKKSDNFFKLNDSLNSLLSKELLSENTSREVKKRFDDGTILTKIKLDKERSRSPFKPQTSNPPVRYAQIEFINSGKSDKSKDDSLCETNKIEEKAVNDRKPLQNVYENIQINTEYMDNVITPETHVSSDNIHGNKPAPALRTVFPNKDNRFSVISQSSGLSYHSLTSNTSLSSSDSNDSVANGTCFEDIILSKKSFSFVKKGELAEKTRSIYYSSNEDTSDIQRSMSQISYTTSMISEALPSSSYIEYCSDTEDDDDDDDDEDVFMDKENSILKKGNTNSCQKVALSKNAFSELSNSENEKYHIRGTGKCIYDQPSLTEFVNFFNRDSLRNPDFPSLAKISSKKIEDHSLHPTICFCVGPGQKMYNSADDLLALSYNEKKKQLYQGSHVKTDQTFKCYCDDEISCKYYSNNTKDSFAVHYYPLKQSVSFPNLNIDGTFLMDRSIAVHETISNSSSNPSSPSSSSKSNRSGSASPYAVVELYRSSSKQSSSSIYSLSDTSSMTITLPPNSNTSTLSSHCPNNSIDFKRRAIRLDTPRVIDFISNSESTSNASTLSHSQSGKRESDIYENIVVTDLKSNPKDSERYDDIGISELKSISIDSGKYDDIIVSNLNPRDSGRYEDIHFQVDNSHSQSVANSETFREKRTLQVLVNSRMGKTNTFPIHSSSISRGVNAVISPVKDDDNTSVVITPRVGNTNSYPIHSSSINKCVKIASSQRGKSLQSSGSGRSFNVRSGSDSGHYPHTKSFAMDGSYNSEELSSSYQSRIREPDQISVSSTTSSTGPTPRERQRCGTSESSASCGHVAYQPGSYSGYHAHSPGSNNKVSPTPPKKPPRRNLSVSPTASHAAPNASTSASSRARARARPTHARSQDDLDDLQGTKHSLRHGRSVDQHVDGNENSDIYEDGQLRQIPAPNPRPSLAKNRTQPIAINSVYENVVIKAQNPKRKLRRNFTHQYENFDPETMNDNGKKCFSQQKSSLESLLDDIQSNPNTPSDRDEASYFSSPKVDLPSSPTHYKQPPTPEHPPPSAQQAERSIHERIRPLSQEYRRRSALRDSYTETERAPSAASHASATSGDAVEEYVADVPFAGLLKGSTTALDGIGRAMPAERPKTLSRRLAGVYAAEPDAVEARSPRPAPPHDSAPIDKSLAILSPFDEQEEWAKISEIMASFGSRLVRESVFVTELEQEFRAKLAGAASDGDRDSGTSRASLASLPPANIAQWLATIGLPHYETVFVQSGYDELDFINGIIDENDLNEMGIDELDRPKIIESAKQLPLKIAEVKNPTGNNKQTHVELIKPLQSVEDWLKNICLEQYSDTFRRHLYVDMDRVKRIWEVELTAVLEIVKTGHRKRILASVSEQQNGSSAANLSDISADLNNLENNIQQLKEEIKEKLPLDSIHIIPPKPAIPPTPTLTVLPGGETLKRSKKSRPAPQPPSADLEIRAPSELLVGVPGALKTQWRHQPLVLITGAVTYVAKYLGSTLVKELRGTESTKKSIQKLKKSTKEPRDSPDIILSISYRGVKFLNTITRELVCEHEIRNIHCACQDADDLTHFAYLTRDHATNTHYCHVFCVATMDQATEVILTLGEAFEVAYQMALRENCNKTTLQRTPAKTPTHDSSAGTLTKEKTNLNHGRSHSIAEIKLNGHQLKIAPIPSSLSNEDFQLSVKNGDTGSRSPRATTLKAPIASTEEL